MANQVYPVTIPPYEHQSPPPVEDMPQGSEPDTQMLLQQPVSQYSTPMQPHMLPDMAMNNLFPTQSELFTPQNISAQTTFQPIQWHQAQMAVARQPTMTNEMNSNGRYPPTGPLNAAAGAAHAVFGSSRQGQWAGTGPYRYGFEDTNSRIHAADDETRYPRPSVALLAHGHLPRRPEDTWRAPHLPPVVNLAPKSTPEKGNEALPARSRKSVSKVAPKRPKGGKHRAPKTKSRREIAKSTNAGQRALPPVERHLVLESNDEVLVDLTSSPNVWGSPPTAVPAASQNAGTRHQVEGMADTTIMDLGDGNTSVATPRAQVVQMQGKPNQREWLAKAAIAARKDVGGTQASMGGHESSGQLDAYPSATEASSPAPQLQDSSPQNLQAKAHSFVAYFTNNFHPNKAVIDSSSALCRSFTHKAISEAQFYIGMYRLVYPTQSMELMLQFKEFLPQSWKDVDLDWLDMEIEEGVESKVADLAVDDSEKALKRALSERKKGRKKVPVNGFRAEGGERGVGSMIDEKNATATEMDGGCDVNQMPSTTTSEHERIKESPEPPTQRPTKIVKLRLPSSTSKSTPTTTPRKRKALSQHPDALTLSSTPSKKRRHLSNIHSTEIPHIGPVYPSRRAVLAREDKLYICALCGEGFKHPADVRAHFSSPRGGGGRGAGCWERNGKPTGEAARWDRHGSCRVGYLDVEYAKVRDGFVVLDRGSWERVEGACEAGRRSKRENEGEGEDADEVSGSGADGEVMMGGDQGVTAPLQAQRPTPQRKIFKAGDENESMLRATALGLRIRK